MKTYRINTNSVIKIPKVNLAIGNFDGVHLGHKKIIENLVKKSEQININSAVLCFLPHPRQFFTKNFDDFNIIDEQTKIELISFLKVNYFISFEFNSHLASYTAEKFVEEILNNKFNIDTLVVGYDFKFGKDREGNVDLLKKLSLKYKFKVSIIDQISNTLTSEVFSSSLIRENIKNGNFEKVSQLLGRNWFIRGKVIEGDRRASKINFPTANLLPSNQIKPRKGVYVVLAKLNNNYYKGIANFGVRPTVDGEKLLLEVHLFNFNKNIYGKELTVEFLAFIRDEKKFDDFNQLKKQIYKDIQVAKEIHKK